MNISSLVLQIMDFQQHAVENWKKNGVQQQEKELMSFVEANHAFNFQLWNAEDKARRNDMGDAFVVKAKREIDSFNQQRNNQMENIDKYLIEALKPASPESCPVNSEAPGMIIDRLSILALKLYHMHLQTIRDDVDAQHIQNCQQKLNQLIQQRQQLGKCLEELLLAVHQKTRTFRVYHQHKMYNDPNLNPELYAQKA
ncbi:MAG TPA: hypothetical protein DCZ80_02750 [Legionellales bacterium]|nr:hypothetical protein [Legionellales bacterium]